MSKVLSFCTCLSPDFTAIQIEGEQNFYYCPACAKCWDFRGLEVLPEWLPNFLEEREKQKGKEIIRPLIWD